MKKRMISIQYLLLIVVILLQVFIFKTFATSNKLKDTAKIVQETQVEITNRKSKGAKVEHAEFHDELYDRNRVIAAEGDDVDKEYESLRKELETLRLESIKERMKAEIKEYNETTNKAFNERKTIAPEEINLDIYQVWNMMKQIIENYADSKARDRVKITLPASGVNSQYIEKNDTDGNTYYIIEISVDGMTENYEGINKFDYVKPQPFNVNENQFRSNLLKTIVDIEPMDGKIRVYLTEPPKVDFQIECMLYR